RRHDLAPSDRALRVADRASPFEPRAGRQVNVVGHLLLRLLDGAAEVAFAYAELDRQVALLALAVDVGRAGDEPYGRDLAQRDLRGAVRPVDADAQVLD